MTRRTAVALWLVGALFTVAGAVLAGVALDTFVRYLGWALELIGLGLAADGIRRNRLAFAPDRPSAVTTAKTALGRLLVRLHPRPRPRTAAVGKSLDVRWDVEAGTAVETFPPVSEATDEERLGQVENWA